MTAIIVASTIWGTTGTAATFAPEVGAAAIGAAAMGLGGLAQAAIAWRGLIASRKALAGQWRILILGAVSVAIYPLAFYASMRMAGVTIGTVISLGSAPLLSAESSIGKAAFARRCAGWQVQSSALSAWSCSACRNMAAPMPHLTGTLSSQALWSG